MADSQGFVERPVRNVADVEFFFVAGMAAGGTRPTVARREFRDWLAQHDAQVKAEALRGAAPGCNCEDDYAWLNDRAARIEKEAEHG